MSNLSKLVQISSGTWVDPAHVKRIYTCKRTMNDGPDITYVVCTGTSSGISLYGDAKPTDHVISSDWPIERITNALGLVNADTLDENFKAT
jgi:hypothetical protein